MRRAWEAQHNRGEQGGELVQGELGLGGMVQVHKGLASEQNGQQWPGQ